MNCSICKEPIEVTSYGWAEGNNAEPINDGRCCDTCDMTKVLPARMEALRTSSREELIHAEWSRYSPHDKFFLELGKLMEKYFGDCDNYRILEDYSPLDGQSLVIMADGIADMYRKHMELEGGYYPHEEKKDEVNNA
jgi:hypothetical protein